jgi:hypothetical protein
MSSGGSWAARSAASAKTVDDAVKARDIELVNEGMLDQSQRDPGAIDGVRECIEWCRTRRR